MDPKLPVKFRSQILPPMTRSQALAWGNRHMHPLMAQVGLVAGVIKARLLPEGIPIFCIVWESPGS